MIKLPRLKIPSLFITSTDTGVGKTIIASAIARSLYLKGMRVAVLKPVASGCTHEREGLVSEDAELLAANSETSHPLDLICPNRYAEPLAPSIAAKRAGIPMDWSAVARSIDIMSTNSDFMILEGVGGALVPLDQNYSVRDLMVQLSAPAVIVARPSLGTINHTLLTIESLRSAGVKIAGIVINRYPTDLVGLAEETSPREIERISKVPMLAIAPDEPITPPIVPQGILSAISRVDWELLAER